MADIFRNTSTKIPTSDPQIVRVDMEQQEIGGRKSHLPTEGKSGVMSVTHVPSAGGNQNN